MRKILLASTALVAVAGISAANAEITFSGNSAIGYSTWSDDVTDNTTAGENGTAVLTDTDMAASWSTTTDTGLTLSVSYDLDSPSSSGSLAGDFGTISWDDGQEAMGVGGGDADAVTLMGNVGDNTIAYSGGETIEGGNIAYSNTIGGIAFGIGIGNGGAADDANETSYGVSYSSSVNGADVSLSYAAASEGHENTAAATTDASSTSMTVGVSVGSIGLDVAQNTSKTTRFADNASGAGYADMKSTNIGLSYTVTDSLTVTAASVAASGTITTNADYKYDEAAYGIDYTIASGVALSAGFSDWSQTGGGQTDVSGTGTKIRLKVSF